MRSSAIRVVGVAMNTCAAIASSSSRGSRSSAGARNASPGTNRTTNSGVGSNCAPVLLRREPATCVAQVPGMGLQPRLDHVGVARLGRVEVGGERHLGVDDDLLAARRAGRRGRGAVMPWSVGRRSACSVKSQCSTMPAISTTRRSCISPHRPRACGARSARDQRAGLVCSCLGRAARTARPARVSVRVGADAGLLEVAQVDSRPCPARPAAERP